MCRQRKFRIFVLDQDENKIKPGLLVIASLEIFEVKIEPFGNLIADEGPHGAMGSVDLVRVVILEHLHSKLSVYYKEAGYTPLHGTTCAEHAPERRRSGRTDTPSFKDAIAHLNFLFVCKGEES